MPTAAVSAACCQLTSLNCCCSLRLVEVVNVDAALLDADVLFIVVIIVHVIVGFILAYVVGVVLLVVLLRRCSLPCRSCIRLADDVAELLALCRRC